MAIQNRKLTINDIARLAGVSTTTVSRVINNSRGVCKENKQKVMAIIEKYAYRPNLYAHRLALRSKEESRLQLDLFIEDLEKQGMPKHCGVCSQYILCAKEDSNCPWIKRYRDWRNDS
jgi:predicted transcriptional regulator